MAAGIVTLYVESATNMLGKANESGFKMLVSGINAAAISAATVAFLLAIFNQFFQLSYMTPGKILALLIKLILISYIGLQWGNFSSIANSVQNGMDSIASALLKAVTVGGKESLTLTGTIDAILESMGTASDKALVHASWVSGAMLSIVVVFSLCVLGAVACLIIIYSKIMISLFIMMAPLFICCLIFERTSDYFYRWLQGAITYALYPVVSASVIAIIGGVTNSYILSIAKTPLNTITEFIPFITVIVIAAAVIFFIPIIVSGLSGMIQHVSPSHIMEILKVKEKHQSGGNNGSGGGSSPQGQPPSGSTQSPASTGVTQPSGPFPGSPASMMARSQRIHGKNKPPKP